ncbi:hypothetical protein P691DRAFT_727943 [Macrolepiota fuliginosa MF-IS2]|uniref:DUF6534 domain-containing protein n=1 Tax=Macrolepiota fuliginosa MF-IS2 TaxID=1400762 RepID=A0A9P5XEW1_9AGAR|nr:hypothetical protein P691DRAFT_727943 [Macrolepiota fuliginosa MF-IS2]
MHVGTTYGAILVGASLAFALSGAISLQCIVYFKMYPRDGVRVKILVSTVWFLDALHSSFICASLLIYFVTFFGQKAEIGEIPWTIAFTVVVTAIQTFLVHCYFCQKILQASGRNWLITGPIVLLALGRLFAASVSTFEMVRLHNFSAFTKRYPGWVFTTGLSLSSAVDVIITGWLCYYLWAIRTRISPGSTVMIRLVDSITIYTLENGALTCFTTTASLICWLTMPKNLVFFGLHFVIGKLYANSLLASLNVRQELHEIRWKSENQSRNRYQQDLSGSSTYSQSFSHSYMSSEMDNSTPTARRHRISRVQASIDPSTQHLRRVHLRHYQPQEPTILEWQPRSTV